MQASVPLDRLPLTVRHTVVLVSLLELEYLWVDALCIIQDCNEDKACEIANMAATYISAFLQVAAMASPGASHGLRMYYFPVAFMFAQDTYPDRMTDKKSSSLPDL